MNEQIQQVIEQISQAVQESPETVMAAIQNGGEEGFKQVVTSLQKGDVKSAKAMIQQLAGARKAAHGAKLQYIKKLKNQCPEGEELYYYKKGGSVGCGCKKKEDGGEVEKAKKGSIISRFKNRVRSEFKKAEDTADQIQSQKKYKPDYSSKRVRESQEDYEKGITNDASAVNGKKCGGKVEKDCDGAVAKFKAKCGSKLKKHQQGGSLNGIPFNQFDSFSFLLPEKKKESSTVKPNDFFNEEAIKKFRNRKTLAKMKYYQLPIYEDTQIQFTNPYLAPGSKRVISPKMLYIQKGGTIAEATSELIPIYGTYKAGQRFFENPSWSNAGDLALSGLGDLALFSGIGSGAGLALKGAKAAKTAAKAATSAKRIYNTEKAKRYYDAGSHAITDGTILYGGSAAIKSQQK